MNRNTAIENRDVFIAFCEGKTIQSVDGDGLGLWEDEDNPDFSCFYKWRVKPEPEVIYVPIRHDGITNQKFHYMTHSEAVGHNGGKVKKFIEVQDND